ncbi:MAG TPA: NAD-glutamate dehydrogenase [Actinomycetes bacterium]|nr:NAD-glutamate dehydrogenase [Actinomycetes bacterium]
MLGKLDEAKADLVARAAAEASRSVDQHEDVSAYLGQFYRHVAAEGLLGRDPVDILGAALSQRALADVRPVGTGKVRVFNPTIDDQGWASAHTVVEVVTDDMPFLVDSMTSALSREGLSIHIVIHPQFTVTRTLNGELQEILLTREARQQSGAVAESWMHLEIDRITDQAVMHQLELALMNALRDVRDAVEDWAKMREAAQEIADQLQETPPDLPSAEIMDAWDLLRWLVDDHFTFLGYREYTLESRDGEDVLATIPGTGLGLLRGDRTESVAFSKLPPEVRAKAREKKLLVLTKANSRSTVHRPAYLDYIGIKSFDADGNVTGERRFLGLFTTAAYSESVQRIPVLRRKVKDVLEASGFASMSHSGKDLMQILETYPRDELFQMSVEELLPIALAVMHLQERRQVRLFLRYDTYGRFASAMVYLPRDRYTTKVRRAMESILLNAFGAETVDYRARVSESVLARLHYVVRGKQGEILPQVDAQRLEAKLTAATRTWDDDLADALLDQLGEAQAVTLMRKFGNSFPEAYKEDFTARTAVADLRRILELEPQGGVGMNLYEPAGAEPGERRFKIYRSGPEMSLSEVLPVLQRMGVEVLDERPYEIEPLGGERIWLYDFGLMHRGVASGQVTEQPDNLRALFQEAFEAAWTGKSESDGFNALVLSAGLSWRQTTVLRAYVKYMRQAGSMFSQDYIEQALSANISLSRLLVRLFETRFDPTIALNREDEGLRLTEEIQQGLEAVTSLDQDRIVRSLLTLINATLRTNYYQRTADGSIKPYVSFKLDPAAIPDLPLPRPKFEIWVYSPRVEGVHLRFGSVARGGLRWSDRREDFRTEVLGLVKAQAVKNAVIVPVGAKGGFLPKQLPDAATVGRDAWLAEGVQSYRTFICALLDITDNLIDGQVVPPVDVIRHDGDDPYLVVAADKGTATFSDIANGISQEYGFWLGDAFASGGSVGYDHKAMGITARGAWESVKRHFRELDVDTQSQDFTVIGVGDMSGDVFGNGMLLSEHIRLVAAFDHRHIFLDPDPDAAVSYAERKRLFELPRSSWDDYDKALISEGGGIYSRALKSVPITEQVRARLGIAEGVERLTPQELMRSVLSAPVDLFWNGGIGTYVKASTESHADVGDKGNDTIRINGGELRAKVVGEGGNLGFTQLGRVEAAQRGVRINTDAIDNSAGVDTSDHEVNIKIMLDAVVRSGDLTGKQRNELLASMTDDVARHVLVHNYEQNVLLGNARMQSHPMLPVHKRLIRAMEERGELDRALEFLPSDAEIDRRDAVGSGLTSPEFSVLVAYSKMTLADDLLSSGLPDEPYFQGVISRYFPKALVERYAERLESHPLRREIITTVLVNEMINRGGITFAFRATEETGATPVQIARAHTVVREVFGLDPFWDRVSQLDNRVPTAVQAWLYLESRRLLDRATRWMLQNRSSLLDVDAEIAHFSDVGRMTELIPEMLRGTEQERLRRRAHEYSAQGVPEDLALDTAAHLDAFSLLDIVELANTTGQSAEEIGFVYFALSDRFEVDRMLSRITMLPRDERWHALARMALRYDLYGALAGLTANVLTLTPDGGSPEERITDWENANAEGLARARTTLHEIASGDAFDLATLSVALRVIRTLVTTGTSTRS